MFEFIRTVGDDDIVEVLEDLELKLSEENIAIINENRDKIVKLTQDAISEQEIVTEAIKIVLKSKMIDLFSQVEKIIEYNEPVLEECGYDTSNSKVISFNFQGYSIYNPLHDEAMRKKVKPFQYYGLDNILNFVQQAKKKGVI